MFKTFVLTAGVLFGGWVPPTLPSEPTPVAFETDGAGEAHLLYRHYTKATGKDLQPYMQGNSPSCVGHALAKGFEVMHGIKFSPEWIFGQSRVDHNPRGMGSWCGWAAKAAVEYGVLPAANYVIMGVDLTEYSVQTANSYGIRGPPEFLEKIAALYKCQGFYKIETWEQYRGAITNGYPVVIGSSVGYGRVKGQTKRSDGSLKRRWWSRWNHALVFIGVDDRSSSAALAINSWGTDWVKGPKRFSDEPAGSFWIRKADFVRMLQQGDCYAILPIEGLPLCTG